MRAIEPACILLIALTLALAQPVVSSMAAQEDLEAPDGEPASVEATPAPRALNGLAGPPTAPTPAAVPAATSTPSLPPTTTPIPGPTCAITPSSAFEFIITPPEGLAPAMAALSGAWEGARGADNRFWMVVLAVDANGATVLYGGARDYLNRPYEVRLQARVLPEGRLEMVTTGGGSYELSLAPDLQQLSGSVTGRVSGQVVYVDPVTLTRCRPR